ncbi:MAG TPA: AsmA family protein, partial [Ramlibacter sp.]|nr:AsmA family protein [Ramlibacter sp.]
MNWRKAGLWAIAILTFLVAACAVALKVIVDPERLKQMARERVLAATGRELIVDTIALRFFPVPSVTATQVALANPEWAREKNLVEAEEVRANLELLPLLTGHMRVKTLVVEGLRASLEESREGGVSWSFQRSASAAAPKPRPAGNDAHTIDIAQLHIRRGSILHLVNKAKSSPWQIEEASIVSGNELHDVVIEAKVARNDQPLAIKARLADLSRLGEPGAVTEGKVTLAWTQTQMEVAGKIPLSHAFAGASLRAEAKSPSLEDVFAFAGFDRGRSAPFSMKFSANDADGRLRISDLALSLGALDVRGEAQVAMGDKKPSFTARLQADRLDWKKALVDAGGTVKPPRDDGQIYHDDPVAWHALGLLGALDGTAEVSVGWLKLGNGIELQKLRATAKLGDGRVALERFNAELLGGSANGSFRFDTRNKAIQVNLDGDNLLLARWFAERGRKLSIEGGPMSLKASLALSGATFRDLAASVKGRLTLRMGRAVWKSPRA